jgi:ferredoxin
MYVKRLVESWRPAVLREEPGMRIAIDRDFCESAGECLRLVPAVFHTDSVGATQAMGSPVPLELEEDVRLAADSCPRLAITLTG